MCEIENFLWGLFFFFLFFFFGCYHYEKTSTILLITNWAHTSANKSQQSLSWALIALSDVGLISSSLFPKSFYFSHMFCTRFAADQWFPSKMGRKK